MIEIEYASAAAQLVSRRLARLRLQALEIVLDDLECMRLEGARVLAPAVSAMIAALARAHHGTEPGLGEAPWLEITIAERQLRAARAELMLELTSLGGGLTLDRIRMT